MWSLGVLTASLLTGALDIPHDELEQLSQGKPFGDAEDITNLLYNSSDCKSFPRNG